MTKMMERIHSKKRGFTLVELIVVIAILAILAAILVPTMVGVLNDSKQSVADANARSVYSAAQSAYVLLEAKGITVATGEEEAFLAQVASNLGGTFEGTYEITIDADGVATVVYNDVNGETGNYPLIVEE